MGFASYEEEKFERRRSRVLAIVPTLPLRREGFFRLATDAMGDVASTTPAATPA
jgi:hypothetical protein